MSERRWWIGILAGGGLCAAALGTLLYFQFAHVEEARNEVAGLRASIDSSRKLIEGTGGLEREVIVLREISEVMKGVLPDTEDVNNLVRTLQRFSEESQVRISGLKKKSENSREKSDFDKVAYTLSLEGDAFQFMEFLDMIESHSRFMRVPNFRITAAQRTQMEREGVPAHKVQVDVETFVYEPKKDSKPVKIDGYDRKRDLLLGEINRRKQGLTVATYSYRGARGRRDPWIDPRVPVVGDNESALSVQQQMDIVQELFARTQSVQAQWEDIKKAENVIQEMLARSELDAALTRLEEDVRRIQAEKSVRYVPSERRLSTEIVDVITALRAQVQKTTVVSGPSESQLKEIEDTMLRHQAKAEYKLMLEAFKVVEKEIALAEADPLRKPIVDRLKTLVHEAHTVIDFEKLDLVVGGVVLIEGVEPAVLINGKTLGRGDMLGNEVIIRSIGRDEVEFIFRGVVFARRF